MSNDFPKTDVKVYVLEEGNTISELKGKNSALSLETEDGCVYIGLANTIRINKNIKFYESWSDLQDAADNARISIRGENNELVAFVQKGCPIPIAPTPAEKLTIADWHALEMSWAELGYKAARKKGTDTIKHTRNVAKDYNRRSSIFSIAVWRFDVGA